MQQFYPYNHRTLLVILAGVYCAIFHWVYQAYLCPMWGYFGFKCLEKDWLIIATGYVFSLLPVLFMPISISRPTQIVFWNLYVLTYIPIVMAAALYGKFTNETVLLTIICMYIGFSFIGVSYRVPLLKADRGAIPNNLFYTFLAVITLFGLAFIIYKFNDAARFTNIANPEDVGSQRAETRESSKGSLVGYPLMIIAYTVSPLLMCLGLIIKKNSIALIGICCNLLLFYFVANKAYLLSIVFLVALYLMIRRSSFMVGSKIISLYAILSLIMLCSQIFFGGSIHAIFFIPSGMLLLRTVGISSLNLINYTRFFHGHEYTYYSHISFLKKILHYPYPYDLGNMIGKTYFNNIFSNYNATFFITDGIAACGPVGIIIVCLFVSIVFWVIDSVSAKHDIKFTTLYISFITINLMNISIFPSLITGGIVFMVIFLRLMTPVRENILPPNTAIKLDKK